jgi:hypothetical protein
VTPPPAASKTPLFVVICAWIVVAIPLGWGLYQSVVKSRPLFTGDTAPAAAPAR